MSTYAQKIAGALWAPDKVLAGFECRTFTFPADYDGPVVATLLRRQAAAPSARAVLYVHGFNDYFFQEHLAAQYVAHGLNFYALDLRKHGRSLLPGQHPNFCKSLSEYYGELSAALAVIAEEDGNTFILLNGHSTGGLIAALYANEGPDRARIDALFLNSPFLAFYTNRAERGLLAAVGRVGGRWPYAVLKGAFSPLYGQSVHRSYHGEWLFNQDWKPVAGFPIYFGWVRAVLQGQQRAQRGLELPMPTLVMHSSASVRSRSWSAALLCNDGVLNVEDMQRYAPRLGPHVALVEIRGGMHDLVLSRPDVRAAVFSQLFQWLDHDKTGA